MQRLIFLITIGVGGLLVACGGDKKISAGGDAPNARMAVEYVDRTWTPADVRLTCDGAHCRPQVGMVVSSRHSSATSLELRRCTATLIARDRVLTSGHCVSEGLETTFILPSGVRKVSGVAWKTFTPSLTKGMTALAPDLAVLKLASPIDDVRPLRVATGSKPGYQSLRALVVNATPTQNQFKIDALTCTVRRHERRFPFDITENPDLIFGFDCQVVPGNSGGPLFTDGDDSVQAVLQASVDPQKSAVKAPAGEARSTPHWIGIATNVRCFRLGDTAAAPCVTVSAPEIDLRSAQTQQLSWDQITRLGDAQRATFPTEMNVVRQRLKERMNGFETLETIDQPTCVRAGVGELTEVKFLSELVSVQADEWGRPKNVVLDRRVSVGRVVSRNKDRYQIAIAWAAPFGPLEMPEQHPSVRVGSPFAIDLPRCAR